MKNLSRRKITTFLSFALFLLAAIGLYWQFYPGKIPLTLGINSNPGEIRFTEVPQAMVSKPFSISLELDTGGRSVNATGLYLNFDPRHLQVLSLDTRSSYCQFYPEKKHDNNLGTITLACGSPHPGVNGKNTLLTIEFMPLIVGTTTLRVSDKSQMLLSDGKGTNILTTYPQIPIAVNQGL